MEMLAERKAGNWDILIANEKTLNDIRSASARQSLFEN